MAAKKMQEICISLNKCNLLWIRKYVKRIKYYFKTTIFCTDPSRLFFVVHVIVLFARVKIFEKVLELHDALDHVRDSFDQLGQSVAPSLVLLVDVDHYGHRRVDCAPVGGQLHGAGPVSGMFHLVHAKDPDLTKAERIVNRADRIKLSSQRIHALEKIFLFS